MYMHKNIYTHTHNLLPATPKWPACAFPTKSHFTACACETAWRNWFWISLFLYCYRVDVLIEFTVLF